MAKAKTVFLCNNCGYEASKWFGKCNACGTWNSCVEETVVKKSASGAGNLLTGEGQPHPLKLSEISLDHEKRTDMHCNELNRVLGGGLVAGSLVLLGGEPGIGKSTLILQSALQLTDKKVLYVSGEESASQLKMRAERINPDGSDCYILSETSLERILEHAQKLGPDLLIVDSIQTIATDAVESSPGSISQVRECAAALLKYAKQTGTPVILVGHITKDGTIAGPKILEHIVDTVLQFEGDQHYLYRILRTVKNRFGSTSELGIFEMRQTGLREISNPSEYLLNRDLNGMSGVAIAATVEGIRPLLIEVQALTGSAVYGTPQRSATGYDSRRMNMLLAVLEKKAGFKIGQKDVFLNIAGGLRINDTASDLAVITAILSSSLDLPVPADVCLTGEVGLSGEIRPVNRIEHRIAEAQKLGFKQIIIPAQNLKNLGTQKGAIEIKAASRVEEAFQYIFKK
ncbi:MAG: DNA repair protein RadA [Paludibacteraceae bacterium]|nr:DNA repair protein RadA [Paludibacteraceae bacterium]